MTKHVRFITFILAAAVLPAQDDRFETRQITVQMKDRFYREFLSDANTAWLGVRLAETQDPALPSGTQVGTIDRAYTTGDQDYQKFAIMDGQARPVFVVYKDETKALNYEVVALVREPGRSTDRLVRLDKGLWSVSKASASVVTARTPDHRAPLQTLEILIFLAFFVLCGALIYYSFVISMFRRLLFHRRWRVGNAETCSNFISVAMVLVLLAVLYLLLFSPPLLVQGDYVSSCGVLMLSFIGFVAISSLVAVMATGRK